jgi:hypothetical protein
VAALAGIALGALTIIAPGDAAQAQETLRVRGAIESIDGSTYAIRSRDGADLKVALADNAQIAAVVKASLADIKQGLFVGVTAMPQADGSLSALEVLPRGDARDWRRTLLMGSSAPEHHDQRER